MQRVLAKDGEPGCSFMTVGFDNTPIKYMQTHIPATVDYPNCILLHCLPCYKESNDFNSAVAKCREMHKPS